MTLDPAFTDLATALEKRTEVISDRKWITEDAVGHLKALQEISEKIESLSEALPRPLDRNLAHFLQRRSYEKALAWIRESIV